MRAVRLLVGDDHPAGGEQVRERVRVDREVPGAVRPGDLRGRGHARLRTVEPGQHRNVVDRVRGTPERAPHGHARVLRRRRRGCPGQARDPARTDRAVGVAHQVAVRQQRVHQVVRGPELEPDARGDRLDADRRGSGVHELEHLQAPCETLDAVRRR